MNWPIRLKQISFFLILYGCSSEQPATPIIDTEVKDTLPSIELWEYDYPTELSNGYYLEHRYYKNPTDKETRQGVFLMKGEREISLISGEWGYAARHKNVGYVKSDFQNSFAFVQSFGGPPTHYLYLLEKVTGDTLIMGYWLDANEAEEILLYFSTDKNYMDEVILYDIKNDKKHFPEETTMNICNDNSNCLLRNCLSIDTVTHENIVLKTECDEKPYVYHR